MKRGRRRPRLAVETLEDRITPTTFTPTTFLDDGTANSLRGAITQANNDDGSATDTIQLAAGTYQLTIANSADKHEQMNASGDLNITSLSHGLVIQGTTDASGNPTTIIQQTVLDRVFQIVNAGTQTNVTFENLVIEGGQAQDDGTAGAPAGSSLAEGGGILDDGRNVTLTNVVLQNNSADAGPSFGAGGGGIFEEDGGSLTIQSSVIQTNHALGGAGTSNNAGGKAAGGGVFAFDATTITNSMLSGNTVTGGGSSAALGGLAAGGGIVAAGPTKITNSMLSGNTVTGGSSSGSIGSAAEGGGVFDAANTTLIGCTLSDNILRGGQGNTSNLVVNVTGDVGGAALGGGLYASDKSTADIAASTLSGNNLTGGQGSYSNSTVSIDGDIGGEAQGGGVFAGGPTTISTSILSGNTLTGGDGSYGGTGAVSGSIGGSASGGGLYVSGPNGTANITASTLSGNTLHGGSGSFLGGGETPGLAQGGGAYFGGAGDTLVNSTIADNQAIGGQGIVTTNVASGGGLFFASVPSGTPTTRLTNVTVADNQASPTQGNGSTTSGGGIDHEQPESGTVILVNTLVALNSASTGTDCAGAVNTSDHNLIGNADGSSGFGLGNSGDLLGSTANPLNPQLGLLANNGGPTQTLALLPGSPAINAGDNSAQSVTGPFDQRGQGFARVVDGTIDIGAFEFQDYDLAVTVSTPPDRVHAGSPVTFAITVRNLEPNPSPGAVLFNTLPEGTTVLGATPSLTRPVEVVPLAVPALGVGASDSFTLTVIPAAPGPFTESAEVSAHDDPDPANNTATVNLTVLPKPFPATGFADVTGLLHSVLQGRHPHQLHKQLFVLLTNVSGTPIQGPVGVGVPGLPKRRGLRLVDGSGTTAGGQKFVLVNIGGDGIFEPGASVMVELVFSQPFQLWGLVVVAGAFA
jgi:uncharacterized repeat protein (TIGR01451 family)